MQQQGHVFAIEVEEMKVFIGITEIAAGIYYFHFARLLESRSLRRYSSCS